MNKIKNIITIALILLILSGCKPTLPVQTAESQETAEKTEVFVERVVDGDTFVIKENEEEIKIRLIGIDTPESVAPQEYLEASGKENSEEGKTASEFTKNLIEGTNVYLEFDVQKEDKYQRRLAYVYLEDGRMLQDILILEGYAELMTIPPNVKYTDHFTKLMDEKL